MKITYERLNQIIEEEVVKFKKLNEEDSLSATLPSNTEEQKKVILKLFNDKIKDPKNYQELFNSLNKDLSCSFSLDLFRRSMKNVRRKQRVHDVL